MGMIYPGFKTNKWMKRNARCENFISYTITLLELELYRITLFYLFNNIIQNLTCMKHYVTTNVGLFNQTT